MDLSAFFRSRENLDETSQFASQVLRIPPCGWRDPRVIGAMEPGPWLGIAWWKRKIPEKR
jgi:hypothetical protein